MGNVGIIKQTKVHIGKVLERLIEETMTEIFPYLMKNMMLTSKKLKSPNQRDINGVFYNQTMKRQRENCGNSKEEATTQMQSLF
jgi:hypothetical protein